MSDRQCSSCGGFCGRGGCKRENVRMSKQREALKMALKALERGRPQIVGVLVQQDQDEAIKAVRETLAEPARKPLTDEQIDAEFDRETWVTVVFADGTRGIALDRVTAKDFARAIEQAHGIGSD